MSGFTAADAVRWIENAIERQIDVVITNSKWPDPPVLERYAVEHKQPLQTGELPAHSEEVSAELWCGDIARHDRRRLAYTVWSVLSQRLLS
jgi:hypothetical protein